jgi:hypothetical protein
MPNSRHWTAIALAVIAGILLLTSGTHGSTGTYQLLLQELPKIIQNQQGLQIANTIAAILIAMSLAGELSVLAGAIIICKNHVSTAKLLISLGAGVGIQWLIMLAVSLITTGQVAAVIAQHSSISWIGVILALAVRIIAK